MWIAWYRDPSLSVKLLPYDDSCLQVLQEEMERGGEAWDTLAGTLSALREVAAPSSTLLMSQQLEAARKRCVPSPRRRYCYELYTAMMR